MGAYTSSGLLGLHVHWVFVGLSSFAFIAALLWFYKHADKKVFLNWIWGALIVGVLGMLLTSAWSMGGLYGFGGWGGHMNGYSMDRMMDYMEGEFDERNVPFDRESMLEEMREHMFGNK